jgi:hypothetical protein
MILYLKNASNYGIKQRAFNSKQFQNKTVYVGN